MTTSTRWRIGVSERGTDTGRLTDAEIERLQWVFEAWPEEEWERGLVEEIKDVLAARELAKMPPFTLDHVRRGQEAFKHQLASDPVYRAKVVAFLETL